MSGNISISHEILLKLDLMIRVNHLTRSYGRHRGIEDISFELETGQVVGLLGPNGAGKSTTIKVLTTHLYPTSGEVTVFGLDVREEALQVRQLLGYLPENAPLYREMITRDFLTTVGELRGLDKVACRDALDRVVSQCGLDDVVNRPIDQLSRGYRQRVGLAQALLHQPRFLVLDEPTSGLDPNQVIEMREIIREIGKENTVLLSSHILTEVEVLCERVLIVDQGKLIADSKAKDLRQTNTTQVEIRGSRNRVESALKSFGSYRILRSTEDSIVKAEVDGGDLETRERLIKFLTSEDLTPLSLKTGEHELESIFAKLTGGQS